VTGGCWLCLKTCPWTRPVYETRDTETPITITNWLYQKVLGINRHAYWPVHYTSSVRGVQNILAGIATCPGLSPGCYIQGFGKISIGDYTQIAPNVGIITANHDVYENSKHAEPRSITIGEYCWIGMGAIILPGVTLGDFTIVGAGAIVTKSFSEGYCVIAGNPAELIRRLDAAKCVRYRHPHEYYGYIKKRNFPAYRAKYLSV
jgi:acetyltransferase-like isoleucine patch superfamily enzyme